MPKSTEEFLKNDPELALLAKRLGLSPEKRDLLVRWAKPRQPALSVLFHAELAVAQLRDNKTPKSMVKRRIDGDPDDIFTDAVMRYPSLFYCRTEVMNQVFLTIGSGYEWDKGAIISYRYEFELPRIPIEAARIIAKTHGVPRGLSRWSIYSNLATMPKNAKPKWRKAAEEFREYLTSVKYQFVDTVHHDKKAESDEAERTHFEMLTPPRWPSR